MNLRYYWNRGFWKCLADIVNFWSGGYRPMGAVFYLPIYQWARLSPVPYRIAILLVIAGVLYFVFRIVLELTKSSAAAAIAAAIVCVHPQIMIANYYNTSFLYDDMAALFTSALVYCYLRFRRNGRNLSGPNLIAIAAFYLAAINSKESAVAAVAWLAGYEIFVGRLREVRAPAMLIVITLLYLSGRVFGPHSLSQEPGYKLEITASRFFVNQLLYLNDFFVTAGFNANWKWIAVWAALAAVCLIVRRRELWWCWFAALVSTLPVAFTVVPRGGASLFVALLAWVMLAATLFASIPIRANVRWAAAVVLGCMLTYWAIPRWRATIPAFIDDHRVTWAVISQMNTLRAHPAPHSRVLFVNDPFDGWDMALIAGIFWNDHTLDIDLGKKLDHPPDLSSYDWILTFDGDKLRTIRTP